MRFMHLHKYLVAGMVILSAACASHPAMQTEASLIAAQHSLIEATNSANVSAVELLTAEEWLGVDAAGNPRRRSELRQALLERGPARIQATAEQLAVRQRDWHVHVYGDIGIVTRLTAGDHGTRAWVTTVWAFRDGRWQRVLSQVTNSSEPKAPSNP